MYIVCKGALSQLKTSNLYIVTFDLTILKIDCFVSKFLSVCTTSPKSISKLKPRPSSFLCVSNVWYYNSTTKYQMSTNLSTDDGTLMSWPCLRYFVDQSAKLDFLGAPGGFPTNHNGVLSGCTLHIFQSGESQNLRLFYTPWWGRI